jgi:hypothetical protein
MDQLKEILKQAIKYRFWIAVSLAGVFAAVAYILGSDPVKKKAKEETDKIVQAEKGVKPYSSGTVPNDQYKPLVDKEKDVLSKDVDASWKKLYARQEPLLTWPKVVEEQFRTWGRKWPENVDNSVVQVAIIKYVDAYPKYVNEVYQTFQPFDPIEGTGVVAAPPESALLKPAAFTTEANTTPSLGKVWAAQERLWIQRTLLQVISEVNAGAKDWDSAVVKQINVLDVGSEASQDQISIGKGESLEEAPDLTAPGTEVAEPTESTGGPMGMQGMTGMGGLGAGKPESVFYIKSESTQYKIMPVHLSVLIDQNRMQDFLIALENSPMAIQAVEFEMSKPSARVTKPQKGEAMSFGMMGSMGGMMGGGREYMRMMGGMGRMNSRAGFGGMASAMASMSGSRMMMDGGFGGEVEKKKGIDKRNVNRGEEKKKVLQKLEKAATHTIHDPYYYIVEVSVYGQARFYNPPPVEPAAEPSQSDAGAGDAQAKAAETAPAGGEPPKAEGAPDAAAKADETTKAETTKADAEPAKKTETPKADAEPAKKSETPKADAEPAKKTEAPKADAEPAKKAETPKADAEPAKAKDAPAPATPKK